MTLKEWFIAQAKRFLTERHQLGLPGIAYFPANSDQPSALVAEDSAPYRTAPKSSSTEPPSES